MAFDIEKATILQPDVAELIATHYALMRAQSPPESCHVMEAEALGTSDVHLLALRENGVLLAIGGLRHCPDYGEIKSMHTVTQARGRGAARTLLREIVSLARALGLGQLYLETGAGPEHAAARRLYTSEGFAECPPFGSYSTDALSVFMSRAI